MEFMHATQQFFGIFGLVIMTGLFGFVTLLSLFWNGATGGDLLPKPLVAVCAVISIGSLVTLFL